MSDERIRELYHEMLNYIYIDAASLGEAIEILRRIGFTEEELRYEGFYLD